MELLGETSNMRVPPLLVTGIGRSGTATMAQILNAGHEKFFNPQNLQTGIPTLRSSFKEVSWLIAPHIKFLQETYPGISILHLVRNPVHVLRSLLGTPDKLIPQYYTYKLQHLPNASNYDRLLDQYLYIYINWNRFCTGLPRIRIEDIANAGRHNTKPRDNKVTWEYIKENGDLELVAEFKTLAEEYGYELSGCNAEGQSAPQESAVQYSGAPSQ